MTITLTGHDIINSFIIYFLIHGSIAIIRIMIKRVDKERKAIIKRHVKDGHTDRLKYCAHPDCAPLTPSTAS